MKILPRFIKLVHLMADYSLTYNPLFFGQFALIQDFVTYWKFIFFKRHKIQIRHYYVGSKVSGSSAFSVPDPTENDQAYAETLEELCREGDPVFALGHFIHKDAAALIRLSDLKTKFQNLTLMIILHCTREEFLRPRASPFLADSVRERRRARRAADFRRSLNFLAEEGRVDCFIAVSESTRQTYVQKGLEPSVPADKIRVVPNGANAQAYYIPSHRMKSEWRSALGLKEGMVIGCTNRWTQAKGKDIFEAILDILEQKNTGFPITFLFPVIVHDQIFRFLENIPDRYPNLFEQGRIRGFLDISKLKRSPFTCNLETVRREYLSQVSAQSGPVQEIFERIFVGFIDFPVHFLFDVYLRPSVAEAFGLGIVEAYLCGVPVISSNRGGCGELVFPRHQVAYSPDIHLLEDRRDPANRIYRKAVLEAAENFVTLLFGIQRECIPAQKLRSRMVNGGYTTSRMLQRYSRLLRRFL